MTKLAHLHILMRQENWREALKLAASFYDLGMHKHSIQRGWEACARPEMYRQMGHDPQALIAVGVDALKERYEKA